MVYEYEKVEDLNLKGYKVIQDKSGFCFGSDAVLLSRFAKPKKGARVLDLCTGTGIIPVLLWGLNELSGIDAVEIVPEVSDMAQRTMELNNLSDKIRVQCADLKDVLKIYGRRSFDAVTCNPPYMNAGGGIVNPKDRLALARHEIACSLDDVVKAAKDVLKPCGKLFMVHRADRMCDVITTMRKYKIEPKRMRIVYPSES
ncbi:MAG: methyltransferase, partial [Clostridia bacterium]|nr:methyltransferase [Clostridia bacterium]